MSTQFWLIHYLPKHSPEDLLSEWDPWKKAVLVEDKPNMTIQEKENNMFDYETGIPVGETKNFCTNPCCWHEDCGPSTLLGWF